MLKRKIFDVNKKKKDYIRELRIKIPKNQKNLEKLEEYKKKNSKLVDKFNEEYGAVIENNTILKLYFTTEKSRCEFNYSSTNFKRYEHFK